MNGVKFDPKAKKFDPKKVAILTPKRSTLTVDFSPELPYNSITIYTKGKQKSMTICQLKKVISTLPEDTPVLIEDTDINEVETIEVQYHADGRTHLILSVME